jgi:hypothetical protein
MPWPQAIAMFVEELGYVPDAGPRPGVREAERIFPTHAQRRLSRPRANCPSRVRAQRAAVAQAPLPAASASAAERRPHDRPARTHPEQPGLGRPGRVIAGLIRAYDIAGKRGLRVTQKVQRALARSSTAKFRPPRSWTTRPSSTAQPRWPGARKRRVADSTTSRSRSLARRNDELNRPRQVILSAP